MDQLWEQAQSDKYDDETLQQIAKADPNELAKMYLEYRSQAESNNQPQMTQEYANSLKNAVGGDKQYNEMLGWAGQNLTSEEIESYDAIMDVTETHNEKAEKLNGRLAMLGVMAALGAYAITGQIIPGVW